jgi:hypothetical protein
MSSCFQGLEYMAVVGYTDDTWNRTLDVIDLLAGL